jgi:hypothetical protein
MNYVAHNIGMRALRLNARAGLVEEDGEGEEEEVAPEERKPPYSYASLIRLAILNADGQKATLSDIYRWIQVYANIFVGDLRKGKWKCRHCK